jgi:endonuclease/exonuclease/phosphatase family metal-dependent hydrolase
MNVTLASYNIHIGLGRDGRLAPERIASVVQELKADVVALQEVPLGSRRFNMPSYLRKAIDYEVVPGPTIVDPLRGDFGNALLTRRRVLSSCQIDLSVEGREPRCALDVTLACGADTLRVAATHLGLQPAERRAQVTKLLAALSGTPASRATILLGDLNEWFLWGRPLRWLHRHFEETPAPATFPAGLPLLALDRIWVKPRHLLRRLFVHASPLARVASDHLPVVAQLQLEEESIDAKDTKDAKEGQEYDAEVA